MLNTRNLERRWLRYKIKSFLPHAVIVLSIVIISTLFFLYNSEDAIQQMPIKKLEQPQQKPIDTQINTAKEKIVKNEQNQTLHVTTKHNETATNKQIKQLHSLQTASEKYDKQVLQPSMNFMKDVQTISQNDKNSYSVKTQEVKQLPKPEKKTAPLPQKKEIPKVDEPTVLPKKVIVRTQTDLKEIHEVEQRFEKNNSPALSLFLARQYYAHGNYEKAYNYALITNQLNKDIEASWIIFSKSLVKLGKKDKAMAALSEYIKYSNSSNAQLLLKDISSGKFR